MTDKPLTVADRRRARHLERQLELQRHAPEMAPCEVTDGIRWTLLSQPHPEACSLLVAHIREIESLRRVREKRTPEDQS